MPIGTTTPTTSLTYNELEAVLNENFPGIDPDLIAREEWGRYEEHSFTVTGQLDQYATELLDAYIQGTWTRWGTTQVLLDAMCLRGAIPAGKYLLDVSW